jgi:branched-chain amino acid aminotransferase
MSKATYIINHNGHLLDGNKPAVLTQNRAFRYGDSLFESICLRDGRMPLFSRHMQRLERSCGILKMEFSPEWSESFFHTHIQQLALQAGLEKDARIRLTIYRAGGGLYAPETNECEFLIEIFPLPANAFSEKTAGLNVSIFTEHVKTPGKLASLKSGNALLYVLASIAAREQEFDDMLLLNEGGNILEATNSNIFYFYQDKLFTPSLADGCVEGVMREYLIENAEITERATTILHLAEADEIFLTNATMGIRSVGTLKNKTYSDERTQELAKKIYSDLWL